MLRDLLTDTCRRQMCRILWLLTANVLCFSIMRGNWNLNVILLWDILRGSLPEQQILTLTVLRFMPLTTLTYTKILNKS